MSPMLACPDAKELGRFLLGQLSPDVCQQVESHVAACHECQATLHGVPHTYLSQHTPYVLVVTDGVKAADGHQLDTSSFRQGLQIARAHGLGDALYRLALVGALGWSHMPPGRAANRQR